MKKIILLMIFMLVFSRSIRAAETTAKTDVISDMQKTFNPREQAKDIERIKQLQDVTGQEWLEMSLGERMDYVMASLFTLKSYGVAPRKTLNDYCNAAEKTLMRYSDLYDAQLTDILIRVIYEKEPASRALLDKFMAERAAKTAI